MRIVQLIHHSYETPNSGGDIRNEAVHKALQRLGTASQIAVGDLGSKPARQAAARTVIAVAQSVTETIVTEIKSLHPDLVVVEGVWLLEVAEAIRRYGPDCKLVFDFHNIESLLLQEKDRATGRGILGTIMPQLNRRRWQRAPEADRKAFMLSDAVWVCSETDRHLLGTISPLRTVDRVIANPVPEWCQRPGLAKTQSRGAPDLLFVGHLGYAPNKIAVNRICTRILPELRQKFPDIQLVVAGRSPNARLRKFVAKTDNAELVASPVDLGPLYRQATIAIVPLSEGGGTRIKVLEALACGVPLVATAKAVEGLGLIDGVHFLEAATDQEFVSAVARLASDRQTAEGLSREGMKMAFENFGAEAIAVSVREAVTTLGLKPNAPA